MVAPIAFGAVTDLSTRHGVLKANDPCWCGSGKKFKRCHKTASDNIRPGIVSPTRSVPSEIPRPPYAESGRAVRRAEDPVQSPEVIERMRRAGRAAAEVLALTGAAIRPGITTDELDAICHQACIDRGGYPSPLNYNGFPKSLCTSVNEVICHGIPDDRPLRDGDICNLDVTIYLDGVHGDTNATFLVGDVDDESRRLVASRGSASSAPSRWWRPECPSTRSAGPSRSTPRPTASAWSAASSATGSGSSSTPTSTCRTTTSRGSTASSRRA